MEPKKIKSLTVSIVLPSICHEVMGPCAMILVFLNIELKNELYYTYKHIHIYYTYIVIFQLLSSVWLFATPRTEACQASLSSTNSQDLLKLTLIKLVMPSNHLNLCCPLILGSFLRSQFFASGGQSIGASASASVLPITIQCWFPLGSTGLISLLTRDSQESSPTPQFKSINSWAFSFLYSPTLTSIHDCWKNHSFD